MHIMMVSESYPPVTNGVAISIVTLRQELQQAGHTVTVVTTRHRRFARDHQVYRVPSFRLPYWPEYTLPLPIDSTKLDAFVQEQRPDVIHCHIPFLLGHSARRISMRTATPLVGHFHTLYDEYLHYAPLAPRHMLRQLLTSHLHRFYSACDLIVTPSRFSRDRLQSFGISPGRVRVIPTGVPRQQSITDRREARAEFHLDPDRPILLYVGRLALEKNLSLLADMMPHVLETRPDCLLWVVGSGPAQRIFQRRVKQRGISDSVRFEGKLPHDRIGRVYSAADLFVFPSVTETQGLVVAEAQSYGLPCITVDHGAAAEAVEQGVNGIIVQNHPHDFGNAAVTLLSDSTLREHLRQGALNHHITTEREMAHMMLQVYQEAIERRRDGSSGNDGAR